MRRLEWWSVPVALVAGGLAYLALRERAPRTAERYREIDAVLARAVPPEVPPRRPLLERLRDEGVYDEPTEIVHWKPKGMAA